jgi:ribosomal protein S18 acetylase RimI-like enzyme
MWVDPAARGTGAADALVSALLSWSESQGIGTVRLHVVEGNARAERLYLRHGFRRTGATVTSADGRLEAQMERTEPPQVG